MPRKTLNTMQDCEDFVEGCVFMGTGGGGGREWGLRALQEELGAGREIGWIDVEDVADEAWTICAYGMGSIAPHTPETEAEMARLGLEDRTGGRSMVLAIEELSQYVGVEVQAIVPIELGGYNTPAPMVSGLRLGIPTVDGDYAGRAIPEMGQVTPYLHGKASLPLSSVDRWGDTCIIKAAFSTQMAERLGKMLSVAGFGGCAMAGYLMPGREMKEVVVRNTLTQCLEIGRTIRQAREIGVDPVEALVTTTGGWLLFKGEVTEKEWEDRGGYMYGTTHIKGLEQYAGHTCRVWFKNENHVFWHDEEPLVTSPDLISVVELETGKAKTNTLLTAGDRVAVVGLKGLKAFRSERGLGILGPTHFGFDINYVPIEERMG